MVSNLIFDIGNVLVRFEPESYLKDLIPKGEDAKVWADRIFLSPYWKAGDRGEMSRMQISDTLSEKYPDHEPVIRHIMHNCDEMLEAMPDSKRLLHYLQGAGYRLFVISNTNREAYGYMTAENDFFSLMDGIILSFREGCLKPDQQIFKLLLKRYDLTPQNCLFIDDMHENTQTASSLGFKVITLKSPELLCDSLFSFLDISSVF